MLNKFWPLDKRIILVALLILVGAVVWKSQSITQKNSWSDSPTVQKISFWEAEKKIAGKGDWKPEGWGSGEYLKTIPTIGAGAVIDLDHGEVIWSMNLKDRIAPASLSKVATIMTALDIASPGKILTVSDDASGQIPTKLGLETGEKLTLDEAVAAALLTSANDATEAISDSIGLELGSGTYTFMELVNKKLAKIGAGDSHFVTSTGLDENGHFSTVYDLAIIAHEALVNYPLIAETATLEYKKLPADSNHKLFDLPNWNALLGVYPGVNGLKIGYTEDAGHSTMVSATRSGKKLLAIVIGAKSLEERELAAATLLNYGFEKNGLAAYTVTKSDLTARFNDWHRQLTQGGP